MTEEAYLTVGELARRVGVTVRTIQYYDQQGLLSPSAKGPQNQRLYTEENVQDLYRILTLKYLGLSLSEIKSDAGLFKDSSAFHALTDSKMDDIEKDFQLLFKRLTTMRALLEASNEPAELDWANMAATIEKNQDDSQFFWRLTCINESGLGEGDAEGKVIREQSVSKWHELIADTIRLMSEHEPLDSEANRDLAQRYLDLDGSQETLSADQNFILMENITPHPHAHGQGH
ncbi:MAG: MerR family transcriptional regulator, partial [Raoultibacter sp.]